jgi:hypothetical protein
MSNKNNIDKNKEQMYQQCLLRKRSGNVSILDVSWIPVEYSSLGKCLKFWKGEVNEDGTYGKWDDGWVVIKIYGVRSESDIVKMDWDYRKWDWIEVE